jgi:multicomponent Na+:H+ antiporter subunit D
MISAGFHPLLNMLTAAICGAFLTGDLFNLYVWFEVMLMASFGLLVMGHRPCQLTGAVKYVTINLISTLFFITAIGLIYGLTGTLNMADLHAKAAAVGKHPLLTAAAMLLMVRLCHQGGALPAVFLAACLLPHPAGVGIGLFCRDAQQGRDLRADPDVHAGLCRP